MAVSDGVRRTPGRVRRDTGRPGDYRARHRAATGAAVRAVQWTGEDVGALRSLLVPLIPAFNPGRTPAGGPGQAADFPERFDYLITKGHQAKVVLTVRGCVVEVPWRWWVIYHHGTRLVTVMPPAMFHALFAACPPPPPEVKPLPARGNPLAIDAAARAINRLAAEGDPSQMHPVRLATVALDAFHEYGAGA